MYICQICDFSTSIKQHFNTHLNTKKHITNYNKLNHFSKSYKNEPKMSQNVSQNEPKVSQNEPKMSQNEPKMSQKCVPKFECKYCSKKFTTKPILKKHQKKNCKKLLEIKNQEKLEKEELLNMVDEMRKDYLEKIEKLIQTHPDHNSNICENNSYNSHNNSNNTQNNSNNTLNNTHNNITINNFGQENLEMLTKSFLTKMIKYPYTAIPKMIEEIYFNDKYPENKNIRMLNKKDNKLQILKELRWKYVQKEETIRMLIEDQNYHMDKFYQANKDKFNETYQKRFDGFQQKMDSNDKCVLKDINCETELVFWNSM